MKASPYLVVKQDCSIIWSCIYSKIIDGKIFEERIWLQAILCAEKSQFSPDAPPDEADPFSKSDVRTQEVT